MTAVTGRPMTAICEVLGIARRTAYYVARARPASGDHRTADGIVRQQIRAVTNSRATYGYRRVWAMVNRTFRTGYNHNRIRRVMQLHGLMLAPRVHRRHGRPHLGQIQRPASGKEGTRNETKGVPAVARACDRRPLAEQEQPGSARSCQGIVPGGSKRMASSRGHTGSLYAIRAVCC